MKLPKISLKTQIVVLLIVGFVSCAVYLYAKLPSPLDAYITQRNCQFIEFAGIHAEACDDGSAWLVEPLKP